MGQQKVGLLVDLVDSSDLMGIEISCRQDSIARPDQGTSPHTFGCAFLPTLLGLHTRARIARMAVYQSLYAQHTGIPALMVCAEALSAARPLLRCPAEVVVVVAAATLAEDAVTASAMLSRPLRRLFKHSTPWVRAQTQRVRHWVPQGHSLHALSPLKEPKSETLVRFQARRKGGALMRLITHSTP